MKTPRRSFLATLAALPLVARQALRGPRSIGALAREKVRSGGGRAPFLAMAHAAWKRGDIGCDADRIRLRIVSAGGLGTARLESFHEHGTTWVRIG